jgi:hypothetical protein
MNIHRLPLVESKVPKSDPVMVVFRIFHPPIQKSVLERDHETRLLEEITRLTPPNAVLRKLASQCTPPEDVFDADEGNERPW